MGTGKERRYEARALTWGLGETETGKEQIAVEFEITTANAEFNRITWFGYFTDKAIERTIESLRYCGWKGCDLDKLDGIDANEVELVIEDEEYNGQIYPKVRWVNRKGGVALKAPMSGDKAKTFAATMRDRIKAIEATSGGGRSSAKPATGPAPHIGQDGGPPPLTDKDMNF